MYLLLVFPVWEYISTEFYYRNTYQRCIFRLRGKLRPPASSANMYLASACPRFNLNTSFNFVVNWDRHKYLGWACPGWGLHFNKIYHIKSRFGGLVIWTYGLVFGRYWEIRLDWNSIGIKPLPDEQTPWCRPLYNSLNMYQISTCHPCFFLANCI